MTILSLTEINFMRACLRGFLVEGKLPLIQNPLFENDTVLVATMPPSQKKSPNVPRKKSPERNFGKRRRTSKGNIHVPLPGAHAKATAATESELKLRSLVPL